MKQVVLRGLAATFLVLSGCVLAGAQLPQSEPQSLGDYARAVRKNKSQDTKPSQTVYDNDNLPSQTSLSVVGNSSSDAKDTNKPEANGQPQTNADDASKVKPGQSIGDREKAYDTWKQKIDAQKEKVDQLARDLDNVKNHPTSTTTVPVWPYNQDQQKEVEDKQKALDQAKAELDQMQEEARKAGVPNSVAQ
jgi:hypothetical protein